MEPKFIEVKGARVHNLKNIDVTIPRNSLTVITGLSGSGKSSLAFDTIYAEGQRRYLETLSAYARQFLGGLERPDVEQITGLTPVISIEQKTTNQNPRSTVGTTTEIYHYLRLLFARAAIAYSPTGKPMIRYTEEQIKENIFKQFEGKRIAVLSPLVKGRKGQYKDLFEQLLKKGFLAVRVNGQIRELSEKIVLDRYKNHFIELLIDKLTIKRSDTKRLHDSVDTGLKHGSGTIMILDYDSQAVTYYSRNLMCPDTGTSYSEPAPHTFSFNSPQGACPHCNGLGEVAEMDMDKIIPDPQKSILLGGIAPLGTSTTSRAFVLLNGLAKKYGFSLSEPIADIAPENLNIILYGTTESFRIESDLPSFRSNYSQGFEGVINYINNYYENSESDNVRERVEKFIRYTTCPNCKGTRLKEESLSYKFGDKNIAELTQMDIDSLYTWLNQILQNSALLTEKQRIIATEIIKEICERLSFLVDVGLGYLSLSRSSKTLSGGESQRIRLATQIGSKLINVLYILDEPSIGLHQRDNQRLIKSLLKLRDAGNTVIVVEHDEEIMRAADWLIDVGPKAGVHGGKIIFQDNPQKVSTLSTQGSITAQYLSGEKKIEIPASRRKGNGHHLILSGVTGNNLKNVTLDLPLGTFTCITGVSGSGKSTLINQTLKPILSQHFYNSNKTPLLYQSITGIEHIDKIVEVDQAPIGRTPRSNPATYTNVFTDIRKLFEQTPDAKIRGYKAGRFSFNVKGGRCEECKGAGVKLIEMNFLPDVQVQCNQCNGQRYNRETLEVKYKGKSINDILNLTIEQAVGFFEALPAIYRRIKTLQEVGLGYITLGQPSTTLSGGESQRVKLATELSKKETGQTLYVLDEPTTGLHFEDVKVLIEVLQNIVEKGNTVIVIEHNLDVIKVADHIIDLGPEGGTKGGQILYSGTPEEFVKVKNNYTAQYLSHIFNSHS